MTAFLIILAVVIILILLPKIKDINFRLINIDIYYLYGRAYNYINFTVIVLVDIYYLTKVAFTFEFCIELVILTILTVFATTRLIQNIYYSSRKKSYDLSCLYNLERLACAFGVPGCGKTSSMYYTAVRLARYMWKELKRKYWEIMKNIKLEQRTSYSAKEQEIINAYEFYSKSPYIPCLWSKDPIKVGKRYAHAISKAQLMLEENIPYGSVLMIDELGDIFPAGKGPSQAEEKPMLKLGRFVRHYFNGYFLFTEQSTSGFLKRLRVLTGTNRQLNKKQVWVCKPHLLIALYNAIFTLVDFDFFQLSIFKKGSKSYNNIYRHLKFTSKLYAGLLSSLWRLIKNIGFRKYSYVMKLNEELSNSVDEKGTFYLPSSLNCEYNERSHQGEYACKDMKPVVRGFNSLVISSQKLEEQGFYT